MNERCENCRYLLSAVDEDVFAVSEYVFFCHRYPPRPDDEPIDYPDEGWCGEYAPKEKGNDSGN
jgi:hypothetical protein